MTDWATYQKCATCGASIGQPCLARSSGGPLALPAATSDAPHTNRRRTAAGRRTQPA